MEKLAVLLVFLMSSLALIPPMFYIYDFSGGDIFPKVYNIILFILLTCIGILIPYSFDKLNNQIKMISLFISGWFLSMLIYEVSNIFTPEVVLQSPSELYVWFKYATCFTLGVGILMVKNIISKWS